MLCSELPRIKRSNNEGRHLSGAYVSFETYKSNAHEIINHRLYDDWQRDSILYNTYFIDKRTEM